MRIPGSPLATPVRTFAPSPAITGRAGRGATHRPGSLADSRAPVTTRNTIFGPCDRDATRVVATRRTAVGRGDNRQLPRRISARRTTAPDSTSSPSKIGASILSSRSPGAAVAQGDVSACDLELVRVSSAAERLEDRRSYGRARRPTIRRRASLPRRVRASAAPSSAARRRRSLPRVRVKPDLLVLGVVLVGVPASGSRIRSSHHEGALSIVSSTAALLVFAEIAIPMTKSLFEPCAATPP